MKNTKKIAVLISLAVFISTLPILKVEAALSRISVIPIGYTSTQIDKVFGFNDGFAMIVNNSGKYGYMDTTGKFIVPMEYDQASSFYEGLAQVYKKGMGYGFIDKTGRVVIPLGEYEYFRFGYNVKSISDGLIRAEKDDKIGYLDKTGKVVIPFEYRQGEDFSEGVAWVQNGDRWNDWQLIDKNNNILAKITEAENSFAYIEPTKDGLSMIYSYSNKQDPKYGFINTSGKAVVPEQYDYAESFNEGLAVVSQNGKHGFIDKTGKAVIPLEYDTAKSFNDGLAIVIKNNKYGFIDKTGKIVISVEYDNVTPFSDGLACVGKDGKYGFIDKTGKIVVPFTYRSAEPFNGGLALVRNDNGYIGYIDTEGNIVLSPEDGFIFSGTWIEKSFNEGFALAVAFDNEGNQSINILEDTKSDSASRQISQPSSLIATPTSSKVLFDGLDVSFDAYNINGNNYFKLRDIAHVLGGATKRFDVGWDASSNAIILTSGKYYTSVGGEMANKGTGNKTAVPTNSKIYLDGKEIKLTAYNIDGNNYFKLRDIGQAFDFNVSWNGTNNTIIINISESYSDEDVTLKIESNQADKQFDRVDGYTWWDSERNCLCVEFSAYESQSKSYETVSVEIDGANINLSSINWESDERKIASDLRSNDDVAFDSDANLVYISNKGEFIVFKSSDKYTKKTVVHSSGADSIILNKYGIATDVKLSDGRVISLSF